MHKDEFANILEALIFAAVEPLSMRQLLTLFEVDKKEIEAALDELDSKLQDRAIFLKKVAGGYQFATRPQYARWIKKMNADMARSRMSRAAMETLSIIAFKQPISRVEINAIRGVNSDGVIKGLLERKLIDIAGRDDGPGRAILFQTTTYFLRHFGINDLSDLPKPKEIEELLASGEGRGLLKRAEENEEDLQNGEDEKGSTQTQQKGASNLQQKSKGADS